MKIFVGNLPFKTTAEDLKNIFDDYGTVLAVDIVEDNRGNSRGFGFVEMPGEAEGNAAITALNGMELDGRTINVSPALIKPKPARHGEGRRAKSYQRRQQPPYKRQQDERLREAMEEKPWEQRAGDTWKPHPVERRPRYEQRRRWHEKPVGRPALSGTGVRKGQRRPAQAKPWEHRIKRAGMTWHKGEEEKERRSGGHAFAKAKPWFNRKKHGTPFYEKFKKKGKRR